MGDSGPGETCTYTDADRTREILYRAAMVAPPVTNNSWTFFWQDVVRPNLRPCPSCHYKSLMYTGENRRRCLLCGAYE